MKISSPSAANIVIDATTFSLGTTITPQQSNEDDCGVFQTLFVDALLASLPATAAEIKLPSDLDPSAARRQMSNIIHELSSSSSSSSSSPSVHPPALKKQRNNDDLQSHDGDIYFSPSPSSSRPSTPSSNFSTSSSVSEITLPSPLSIYQDDLVI
jgi:hypothetical protein